MRKALFTRGMVLVCLVALAGVSAPAFAGQCTVQVGSNCPVDLGGQEKTPEQNQPRQEPIESLENQLFAVVNDQRAFAGLPPFKLQSWAAAVARRHAIALAQAGTLYHNNDYIRQGKRAMSASAVGENVAMEYSIAALHKRLMDSPKHRSNILSRRFDNLGVGIARDSRGRLFAVQDFARLAPIAGLSSSETAALSVYPVIENNGLEPAPEEIASARGYLTRTDEPPLLSRTSLAALIALAAAVVVGATARIATYVFAP